MKIPSYKIQNVLKCYSRRLIESEQPDEINLQRERKKRRIRILEKRLAVIERITAQVISEQSRSPSAEKEIRETVTPWKAMAPAAMPPSLFVYRTIDGDERKQVIRQTINETIFGSNGREETEEEKIRS